MTDTVIIGVGQNLVVPPCWIVSRHRKNGLVTVRLTRLSNTGGDVLLHTTIPHGHQAAVIVHWFSTPGTLRAPAPTRCPSGRRSSGRPSPSASLTARISGRPVLPAYCQLSISPTSGSSGGSP